MRPSLLNASLLLLLALAGTACRKEASSAADATGPDVVATVGGRAIRRSTLERELARRGPGATKEAVLAELVRFETVLAKARAAALTGTRRSSPPWNISSSHGSRSASWPPRNRRR